MFIIPGINLTKQRIIAATGAGGKSSFLQFLAKQLKLNGKRVLLTTTTHIYHPDHTGFSQHVDQLLDHSFTRQSFKPAQHGTITVAGKISRHPLKLSGIAPELPYQLITDNIYDYVLVESDGAKQRPLKAPAEHEPVMPDHCHMVVGVTGWQGINHPISPETVHRWPEFCAITGLEHYNELTPEAMSALLDSPCGLFKDVPDTSQRIWLINQLDNVTQRQAAKRFAKAAMKYSRRINTTLLANLRDPRPELQTIHDEHRIKEVLNNDNQYFL